MAKLTTLPDPEILVIPPAQYAILPVEGGFEFEADAEFFMDYDEATDQALDWSVEIARPVRVYHRKDRQWVPVREVKA